MMTEPRRADSTPRSTSVAHQFLRALPKAHLHVHLEGTMRSTTSAQLASVTGQPTIPSSPYIDFTEFASAYAGLRRLIRGPSDLQRIAEEYVADAAEDGIVWSDVHFSPVGFPPSVGEPDELLRAVLAGFSSGGERSGASVIVVANPQFGHAGAAQAMELASAYLGKGVSGIGYVDFECSRDTAEVAALLRPAIDAKVPIFPHAGETGGAEVVAQAVDLLAATRICHGLNAVSDPLLLQRLKEADICLDISVTSNDLLGIVPADEHPLPRLLEAGVPVTLNADDPGMFGTTLTDEYLLAHERLGIPIEKLVEIARTSLNRCSAPAGVRAAALARLDVLLLSDESL